MPPKLSITCFSSVNQEDDRTPVRTLLYSLTRITSGNLFVAQTRVLHQLLEQVDSKQKGSDEELMAFWAEYGPSQGVADRVSNGKIFALGASVPMVALPVKLNVTAASDVILDPFTSFFYGFNSRAAPLYGCPDSFSSLGTLLDALPENWINDVHELVEEWGSAGQNRFSVHDGIAFCSLIFCSVIYLAVSGVRINESHEDIKSLLKFEFDPKNRYIDVIGLTPVNTRIDPAERGRPAVSALSKALGVRSASASAGASRRSAVDSETQPSLSKTKPHVSQLPSSVARDPVRHSAPLPVQTMSQTSVDRARSSIETFTAFAKKTS